MSVDEAKLGPAAHDVSPYFMDNDDQEKYVKKGEIVYMFAYLDKWISKNDLQWVEISLIVFMAIKLFFFTILCNICVTIETGKKYR